MNCASRASTTRSRARRRAVEFQSAWPSLSRRASISLRANKQPWPKLPLPYALRTFCGSVVMSNERAPRSRIILVEQPRLTRLHRLDATVEDDLLDMRRHLERIADHAKNIAQEVVFIYEGTDIRHQRKQARQYAQHQRARYAHDQPYNGEHNPDDDHQHDLPAQKCLDAPYGTFQVGAELSDRFNKGIHGA